MHLHLFSSDSFSSTLLSSNLSLLSASALLCFSSVHIVGSLTSKLPSTIYIYMCVCVFVHAYTYIIEGSLEAKLPTIWTDEKQRWEESDKRREEERISKKRKSQKKEDPGVRKGGKFRGTLCFSNDLWGAEPGGQMRNEKLHIIVARSTSPSQNVQSTPTVDHF